MEALYPYPFHIMRAVKEAIRKPYVFPGGYEKALYLEGGERLCLPCARENWKALVESALDSTVGWSTGWAPMGVDVYWEGPSEFCGHCNREMQSEYGDPDAWEPED